LEALSFIDALTQFIELIAILIITCKIEQKEVNGKIFMKGLILAILMMFFSYYIRFSISRVFPLIGTSSVILFHTLFIFILFNQFYRNTLVGSVLKTSLTILIVVICQLTLIPFFPIVSSILGYELMMDIMGFFAQFWIIAFMFFIYPRFRNRVNKMILDFSNHTNYVMGSYFYFIVYVIAVTYLRTYLIDNVFALVMMVLMSLIILSGLTFMIYKYFIKADENPLG